MTYLYGIFYEDAKYKGMHVHIACLFVLLFSLSKRSFAKRNLRAKLWIDIAPFYTKEFRKSEEAHKEAYRIEWHRIHESTITEEKEKHEEQDKKLSIQEMNRREHTNKLRDRQRLIEETEKSKAEEVAKSKAKRETKKKKNQEEEEKRKKAQEASNKKTQEEEEKKKYASEQAEKALIRAKEQDDKRMKEESEKRKKAAERKAAIEAKKRQDLFGIMVISRRDDVKRRNIIRETWGNYSKDTPIYFMVGTHCPYKPWHRKPNSCTPISEDIVISKRYVSEQEARTERLQQEDNVVVLDAVHVDDQRAKMMYLGYEWMYKHVRKRYTLKTEEAYDVDVGSLHEWLYNHSKNSYYNEIFAESFDRANAEEPQGAHLIISKYVLKRLFKSKAAFDGMTFNGIIRQKFVLIGRIILSGQYFSKV